MDSFKDREKNFEKKFAHDEELQFKVDARRNKYLGQWVSQILSYDLEKEKESLIKFKNIVPVSLGNRLLRSDTAITVSLYCIQELLG